MPRIATALVLLGAMAVHAQEPTTATIRGRVVAADTGLPIAFARVGLVSTSSTKRLPDTVFSDSDGRFQLTGVSAGRYTVSATKTGYLTTRFGAHSAALGATFYTGNQFPARYRNGAFVAMHGSWNRSKANGYRVGFVPFQNGKPGPVEDFLTGFVANDGADGQITTWGRPVGVTVAKDGSLLVSDDGGNRIWKISYRRQ